MHLDALVDNPPPAGSREWLPLLQDLVMRFATAGGNWTLTVDVGVALSVPEGSLAVPDVFEHADVIRALEAPAVCIVSPIHSSGTRGRASITAGSGCRDLTSPQL